MTDSLRTITSFALALIFALGFASVTSAQAVDPEAQLSEIREQVLYANYGEAETALDAVLVRTDLTPAQRNAALEVRATILVARGEEEAAQK